MKKSLLSIFIALFSVCFLFGQYSAAQYIKAGNKALAERPSKNFVALINFSKAIELGESNPELIYNYGLAAHNAYAYGLAESALEEYVNTDEGVDRGAALLLLAETKEALGKYEDARTNFDLYISEYSDVDPTATARAKQGKKATSWAVNQMPLSGITIEHPGREINSDYADVSPVVFKDKLYFSTSPSSDDVISNYGLIVTEKGGPVKKAKNFNEAKKEHYYAAPSFTDNGKVMIYSLCIPKNNQYPDCKLYMTKKEGKSFGNGVALSEEINYPGTSTAQSSLVSEGDGSYTMYFSSNRPGGKGGYDIWVSTMNSEMDFSTPRNVKSVNTSGDDGTPFYHAQSSTLYFSSDGRDEGFGEIDIYRASKTDAGFGMVSNMGTPINSPNKDRYFWLNAEGDEAYLVSNRAGSFYSDDKFETCCHDIYRLDIALECEMTVNVKDCNSGIPLGGQVTIKDLNTGEEIYSGPLSGAGQVTSTINRNNEYEITVKNDCYPEKTMKAGPFPDAGGEAAAGSGSGLGGDDDCTTDVDMCLEGEAAVLNVCAFDEKTSKELNGSEVCLLDVASGEQECKKTGAGNCTSFDIIIGKEYTLTGKKATYLDKVVTLHADCKALDQELYLGKRPLTCMETLLPLSLYFENGKPGPRSNKSYPETCEDYYSKKEQFKRRYISDYGFKSDERVIADAEMESFFNNDLKGGCDDLESMFKCILDYLKDGNKLTLELRGHASPLASDSYNERLSQRRIDSIKKAMMEYQDGALKAYIDSGQLTLIDKPLGETMADESVSDKRSRPNKSIYSPEAARERRVEIHRVITN